MGLDRGGLRWRGGRFVIYDVVKDTTARAGFSLGTDFPLVWRGPYCLLGTEWRGPLLLYGTELSYCCMAQSWIYAP